MQIETYDNADALETLSASWKQLSDVCPRASLFTSPDFIIPWCRHFGSENRIRISVVREGGELVAVAPMIIAPRKYGGLPVRMLSFVNNKHVSRCDIVTLPGRENEVYAALVDEWLKARAEWDVFKLTDVPESGKTLETLDTLLNARRATTYPIEWSRTLYGLPVDSPWEQHLAKRNKKFRANLRLYANRAEKQADVQVKVHRSVESVRTSMDAMFELQERSWKGEDGQARLSPVDKAFTVEWVERMARQGGMENWFMSIGEKVIGALHILTYKQVQYYMLVFYDQAHQDLAPGRYLFALAIENAFRSGSVKYLDFNGDSQFVQHWATDPMVHQAVSACHSGAYSRIISGLKKIKRFSARSERPAAPTLREAS